jgi:uncharacterized repeat protein (TIGR01451 family)
MMPMPASVARIHRASRQAISAWRALGASLFMVAGISMTAPAQIVTPPDTARIVNSAAYRFTATDGTIVTDSASVSVLLRHLAGLTLTPPRAQGAPAGVRRTLAHTLRNAGTAADAFSIAASAPAGWSVTLYLDVNADGLLDAGDTVLPAAVPLARNATLALLVAVDIPAGAAGGTVGTIDLNATSLMDATVRAALQDRLTVVAGASPSGLALDKTVDRAAAVTGDTLTYSIAWVNVGLAATSAATVTDVLPRGAHVVPGSVTNGGLSLTDAADGDAGQVTRDASGLETVRVSVGAIPVNGGGVVTFRATIGLDAAAGALANVATLDDGTPLAASQPAVTTVSIAMLSVAKAIVGTDSVAAGDLVTYAVTYRNASSTVQARGVTIVDTLPAGLTFVSADGAPAVSGQVVTWTIGTLGQQSVTLDLVVRAARPSAAGLVNAVAITAANAAGGAATAAPLRIAGWASSSLTLTKTAQVLDVALGEPVPYLLVLRNVGTVPLNGFVVRDLLPAGLRYVPGSLSGADSATVVGELLTIWLTGTLAPAEERTVRYAAVLATAGANRALLNRAVAEAEDGLVVSDTASVAVRVRAGYAMQGRSLIGKVYLDRNSNGVQDAGEEGVAGAQILTADGQVVTADKEGRYSLRDVVPGTHALRLDVGTAIPSGFGLARAAEEMVVVRTDGWTTPRADFRLVPRKVADPPCECPDSATMAAAGKLVRLAAAVSAPRLAPLRAAGEREAEEKNAFIAGPGVRISSPADGAILSSNRVYVGVKGEPGTMVTLYEGDKQIGQGTLRPDGVQDFVGVELAPGPHRLRARIVNSWKNERWDSVTVHRSGTPAAIELVDADVSTPLVLRVDADSLSTVRVRVLDMWKVPVSTGPHLTVEVVGASLEGEDSDAGSLGQQRSADANGTVTVALRAGHDVGDGHVIVRAGEKVSARRALRILPTLRAFTATGTGQIGVGAATESFGAVSARGAIGRETSVTMSYDSRRGTETDFFGRGYDPLDEARYATYGDGSERRVLSAATQRFSARLEHGLNWVELGDVVGRPASGKDALLAGYQRSLSGVSARVGAGGLTVHGFGSMTSQALEQQQLRGDGGSGPYVFGAGTRPGTDRITIEVRARDNAARVIARETLVRFSDYQIDYVTGAVLLRRPVPADDAYGNPVFVVAALERESGGAQHFVGGGRVEASIGRAFGLRDADSLVLAVTGVRDGGASATSATMLGSTDIVGADLRLTAGGLALGGELLRTMTADSTGSAARASLRWTLPNDRASLGAHWMQVDSGMTGSLDPRLGSGLSELHVDAALKLGTATALTVAHDRQHFSQYGIDRQNTTAGAKTTVGGRAVTQEIGLSSDVQGAGGAAASSLTAKTTVAVASRVDAWIEGSHALAPAVGTAVATPTLATRPDQMGAGVAYRITDGLRLEATHRVSTMPDSVGGDPTRYAVTSVDVRTSQLFGGEAWGGVERAGSTSASHAAVLGWNQRLAVGGGWSVSTLYERRVGLSRASLVDPVRALPFARTEGDRWSAGGGLEWLPSSDHSRFSLRGEARNGDGRRGSRVTFGGDAPLGASMALITLHDWSRYTVTTSALAGQESRQDRSLLGMALRPVGGNVLNLLGKVEWRRTLNPLSGAAGASTVLGGTGEDRRLLGAADAILSATRLTEIAARYAVRWSANEQVASAGGTALGIRSQYMGLRAEQGLTGEGALRLRVDGRMMLEQASGAAPWSVAPSLALRVGPRLELEGGYRMGDLLDRDFAANGGSGLFASVGVRLTEHLFGSPAAFWRDRVAGER